MYGLVDEHRDAHVVESICTVLQIAPSGYRRYAARRRGQTLLSGSCSRCTCRAFSRSRAVLYSRFGTGFSPAMFLVM